ncbi:sensor histidine kinase [Nonomuraea maritima]|uniref:sensor histidine kinase n=1 Tax=Nonomuraea maritima TaxID=683260 RepID=UPI003713B054
MSTRLGVKRAGEGWRLRNWRVRARLVALILVPTAAAVLLGGIQVLASAAAAADYARTNQFAQLSAELGDLTHLVAAERAKTSWYIARGRPGNDLAEVQAHMARVDLTAGEVRGIAAPLLEESTGRAADQLENLLNRLDDLTGLRKRALEDDLLPGPAVELYTTVLTDLLSVHNELVKGGADDELFRQTRMLDGLARAKESVSYQQALITVALVEGAFDTGQLQRLLGEQAREANERKSFTAEATAEERRLFDETVNGASADRMLFLRELVLIRATDGLPLRGLDRSAPDDAKTWFDAANVVVDNMHKIEQRQAQGIVQRSETLSGEERQRAFVTAGAVLALLVAVLLITTGVARSLVRPLRRLRGEALEIAGKRLPEFVQHLREARDGEVVAEVPPIGIFSRDEVGEVARAFDEVHREAVRLAGDEARLRSNVNAMFVNLSRRSQTLVERQLTLIEKLERGERDDTRLGDLFKLDHLATRMRRNSENLLVLAGQEAARRWSEPIELMDIVRAALGEVESYDRVSIQIQSDVAIAGQAVTDVVHLLAELVENAVSFSPNDTKVIISSSRIDGGSLMVSVTDRGIGMTTEELGEANWRLANPPVVDVSVSRRMGLFVVGRLALRHNIRVQLRRQDEGGLTAMVLVPPTLLTAVQDTLQAPAGVPSLADQGHRARVAVPRQSTSPSYAGFTEAAPHPSFDAGPLPSLDAGTLASLDVDPAVEASPWFSSAPAHTDAPKETVFPAPVGPPRAQEDFTQGTGELEAGGWFSKATPTADRRDPSWSSGAERGLPAPEPGLAPSRGLPPLSGPLSGPPTGPPTGPLGAPPAGAFGGTAGPPAGNGTTDSGLPKRTPRANLASGAAPSRQPSPPPAPPVSPDRLRSRLSGYQQGVRRGRAELEDGL